jgi:enterochelin esterase-like enzyme
MIAALNQYLEGWHWYCKRIWSHDGQMAGLDRFVRRRIRTAITGRMGKGWWLVQHSNAVLGKLGLISVAGLNRRYRQDPWDVSARKSGRPLGTGGEPYAGKPHRPRGHPVREGRGSGNRPLTFIGKKAKARWECGSGPPSLRTAEPRCHGPGRHSVNANTGGGDGRMYSKWRLARAGVLAAWVLAGLAAVSAEAQQSVHSPEVHADRRVTFRLRAPNAKEVLLSREGAARVAMQKDERGVWSVTTEVLEPDHYGYSFLVDGVEHFDPNNPVIKPNFLFTASEVHVPGPASLPWEVGDVPRGTVHRHYYRSGVVGDHRDFYVYTPPGYDARARKAYPVLYLLHGFSDDARGWTAVGRANVILDNLIAQGKAKPMLVVMPLGYGAPEIVSRTGAGNRTPDLFRRNYDRFRDTLLTEVIPQVESLYRVQKDRDSRAIAGLSMGGAESLFVGLNALDRFGWMGAFSSGGLRGEYAEVFPKLTSADNERLRLLWIACGTADGLIESNRRLKAWLKTKQVRFRDVETPGAHTWMVWRRNLAAFAPLLFRDAGE